MGPLILAVAAVLSAAPARASGQGVAISTADVARAVETIEGFDFPIELRKLASPAETRLGRDLFFERRLSRDGDMSCATCHQPARAFTDGRVRARGHGGRVLQRNVPSLFGVTIARSYVPGLFLDGRAASVEEVALHVFQEPTEMDNSLERVTAALAKAPGYARRFREIYGPRGLTPPNVARALAAYVHSLAPNRPSAYDRVVEDPDALSPEQKRGLLLFVGKAGCINCHWNPDMTNGEFINTGLKPTPGLKDTGRFVVTRSLSDWRAFKVPSLRDVALTAPYMHDGSLATLDDVVAFYDRGGDGQPGQNPLIRPLHLTPEERRDLAAFLSSLTNPDAGAVTAAKSAAAPPAPAAQPSGERYWSVARQVDADLDRASELIGEAEALRAPWTRLDDYAGSGCARRFSPESLLQDEAAYRFGADEADYLARYVSPDVVDYFKYRAFAERDPGLCDGLGSLSLPNGHYKGKYSCRNWYVEMTLVAALLGPRERFAASCRDVAGLEPATRAKAEPLCATMGAHLDDLPGMCEPLIPSFLSRNWARECRYFFATLQGQALDCAAFSRVESGYRRCQTYEAVARAWPARDPDLCGGVADCEVLLGRGPAVAERLAEAIKAKVCRAGPAPADVIAEPRREARELLERARTRLAAAGPLPDQGRQAQTRLALLRGRLDSQRVR